MSNTEKRFQLGNEIMLGNAAVGFSNEAQNNQSCYNAKYQITKGGNTINLIEQAFENIVYCDVSRFAGKLDVATKEYKHAINGEEDLLDEDFYDDCIEDPQIMDFETKAFTAGRSAAAAAMWPNLRNNMQLCPQWLRVLLAKGGINNFEQKRYYGQLAIQNQLLPDYPWPQVKPVTPQKKGLRGNPQEHISMHDGIWLEHTLFHEV
ncbi:hypothetical protein M7I_6961 [Glarea lozoyensis 74030]|uniref:Uncharacterized protein n=1 Tax=Glarea lozoyensis (strain ATCC 74030 / MF5533) TaxID=1104152 RepID=H0EW03_GLAL7|nr:hypothetical protein M7I_6961 [Glarea lozoyensis 74030]